MEELVNKKKQINHYQTKHLIKEEQLEYENKIGYNWNKDSPFEKLVSDTTTDNLVIESKNDWIKKCILILT